MIKMMMSQSPNYKVIYEDQQIKSTNLNTGEVFGEGYFLSIDPKDAKKFDFNLILNTHGLVESIPRKNMTNVLKKRLKFLQDHLRLLVDIHMGRAKRK